MDRIEKKIAEVIRERLSKTVYANQERELKKVKKAKKNKASALVAYAIIALVPSVALAQPEQPCSTPVPAILDILDAQCGDDADCLYMKVPGWLRCAQAFDWEATARTLSKQNGELTKQNSALAREVQFCVQASSTIFDEKAKLERENARLKSRIRKLLQRR